MIDFYLKEHIPADFDDNSRVWIYQSSRLFTIQEALQIEEILENFVDNWKSHGADVKGYANLFYGQFIVLMADETTTGVSGCSTDSSVHIIKQIEKMFSVDMFNRQQLAFVVKDKIQLIPYNQLEYAVANNFIDGSTKYFNNTVLTKKELTEKWIIPAAESWLATRVNFKKELT